MNFIFPLISEFWAKQQSEKRTLYIMYNNNKIKHEVVIFFFIMGKTFRICEFHNYEQWIIFADDMFKH